MNDIETGIPPLLISAQEARQRLGIGLGLLNRLVASGDLPVVWVGGCRRFRLADLQQFVERLAGPLEPTRCTNRPGAADVAPGTIEHEGA